MIDILQERNQPGFLHFLVQERHHEGIGLADDVVIDVVQPVDLFLGDVVVHGAVDPAILRHVGHRFALEILGP